MESLLESYQRAEKRTVKWMAANGIALLRVSLGIVFLWFGALKFIPSVSPAEGLATATIGRLTFGLLDAPSGGACKGACTCKAPRTASRHE